MMMRCQICESDFNVRPDYTPDNRRVRGMLCLHCWGMIRHCEHDPALLRKAISYIEETAIENDPPRRRSGRRVRAA